jgi:hypothetical protein
MGFLRSERFKAMRGVLVAVMAYVIAATGLIGAVTRTAHGLDAAGSGFVIICTIDGASLAHDGSEPAKPSHPPQHCALCNVTGDTAAPTDNAVGKDVEPPVAARAPARTYDPILPARALAGWVGTRSPRAPPVNA